LKNNNSGTVLIKYVQNLKLTVTKSSIVEELERHPESDSLLGLSDVLNTWHVPNAAYNVPIDELQTISNPFIASLAGQFVMVSSITYESVWVSNEVWENYAMPIEDFRKLYSGFILVAEPDLNAGEPNYIIKRRKQIFVSLRWPFLIVSLMFLLGIYLFFYNSYLTNLTVSVVLLTVIKSLGITVSVLLLMQTVSSDNPFVRKFCFGKNNNCGKVLASNAAKIGGIISWSEIGFIYFAGSWLILLVNSHDHLLIQVIGLMNLLGLPYTFYSLYYQKWVIKEWCTLCCTVQILLWTEFFTLFFTGQENFDALPLLNTRQSGVILVSFLVPVIIWVFLKPIVVKAHQIEPLKEQLRKFKYNTNLFQQVLNKQPRFALPQKEHSIILGNPEAELIITMVTGPFCNHCAKAHRVFERWLEDKDDLQLQVIFAATSDMKDPKNIVANHFLSLKKDYDSSYIQKAMESWYNQDIKDYEFWAKKHPLKDSPVNSESLEIQQDWCKMVEITGTPTVFVNGYKLPDLYLPEDIKYFF
jgi:uncharacterized membrane protein/glutaredoxin